MNRSILIGAVFFFFIAAGLIAFSVFIFLVPKQKAVSGISYYEEVLVIEVNDQTMRVEPFGNYSILVTTDEPISFRALNAEGNMLLEKTYEVDQKPAIIVEILSPEESSIQSEFCFVEADVTQIYYLEKDQEVADNYIGEAKSVKTISSEPSRSIIHDLGHFGVVGDRTVYPGRYDIADLPDELDGGSKITGVFPVTCESLNNVEDIRDQIYIWRFFEEEGFDFGELLEG